MSRFTVEMVDKYASDLLIGLTEEEKIMVTNEFAEIDSNINRLNEIDNLNNIEPMTHCLDNFEYILREDVITDAITNEEALSNCDETDSGYVSVPKVVG